MEDTVKQRLIKYLKYKKLSHIKFQTSIGASNGYVHNIKNTIHPNFQHRISSIYPDLNMDWLLRGEGEMIVDQNALSLVDNSQNGGNLIENSNTGDVTQVHNDAGHSEANELLRQILRLKDEMQKIKNLVFKARLCPTHEECIKKLDEIIEDN